MQGTGPLRRLVVFLVIAALFSLAGTFVAARQVHVEGTIGPGSSYVIDVPDPWNGDLVLYAHGIVQADEPVALPTTQDGFGPARDQLLAAGYAVAASSYSANGWALTDAVQRTHQLGNIFTSKFGKPQRTFLVGHSLGALTIVKMAEQYPTQYAGALAMCGPLGGALKEIEYAGNARVTFDFYFPGLLPPEPFNVPAGTQFLSPGEPGGPSALFWTVASALAGDPQSTGLWAVAAGLPYFDANDIGLSALYVLGFTLRYTNDFVERANGKLPFDNMNTVYQVNATLDPATNAYLSALLNAGVARYQSDPAAVNYYTRNYEPTGRIGIPVLTLHNTLDPGIPFAHEAMFAEKVVAAGRGQWLEQRAVPRLGHCAFTTEEIAGAFSRLVQWVNAAQ